jgi:hypothetical protein
MNNSQVKLASGLNILFALWLIASPFILGFAQVSASAMWAAIVVGVIVLILAWIREASPDGATWPSWVNVVLGVWTVIAPFVMGQARLSGAMVISDIITGAAFIIFGAWSALATPRATTP